MIRKIFMLAVLGGVIAIVYTMANLSPAFRQDIAIAASVKSGADDCNDRGDLASRLIPALARAYLRMPGTRESLIANGGSFVFAGITGAAICKPGNTRYRENLTYALSTIQLGLSLGESVNRIWIDGSHNDGFYPTHFAVMQDQLDVLKFLINKGADISLKSEPTARVSFLFNSFAVPGLTPVQTARKYGGHDGFVGMELIDYLQMINEKGI